MENNTKASVGRNLKGFIPPAFGGRHEQLTMKTKLRQTVVKMVISDKNKAKIGIILLGIGGAIAKADHCWIDCISVGANSPRVIVAHVNGAVEGRDSKDDPFFQSPASHRIDFYSKKILIYPPYDDRLSTDARGANSTTDFDIRIEGAEIPDNGTIDAELSFQIKDSTPPQNNYLWKNLILELYNSGDVNEPNNLIARYDT